MTENQKLREALQAISHIDDTTNHSVDASAALDRIGQIARQALALPTADHIPDAGRMVVDHFPDATKMIETAAPVGELPELPEPDPMADRWLSLHIYTADQMRAYARASLSAGDAVDAQMQSALSLPTQAEPAAQEAVACGACNGSRRVPRDPDIGTDQECFACDGSGLDTTPQPAPASAENHIPDAGEMVEAAAPVGERDAFERTMMDKFGWQRNDFKLDDFGYFDGHTDTAWMAWQARAALSAQAVPNPWRDAVIEQLESWHIYVPAIHENSPRLAIKALVNIETQAALDPKVSSQAAALAAGAVPDERDKVALSIATDALDEIALAGMSGTGQESEEAMRDWHARQAWKFIGIAARAKSAIDAARKGGAA